MQRAFEAGVGTRLGVPGYAVSGKSGTAQVAVGGRYSATLYTSVFAGFVPAGHPQVCLVVSVYGAPQNYQGSQLAGPIFSEVASEMLARWGQMPQTTPRAGAK